MTPESPKIGNPGDPVEIGLRAVPTCPEIVKACWTVCTYITRGDSTKGDKGIRDRQLLTDVGNKSYSCQM